MPLKNKNSGEMDRFILATKLEVKQKGMEEGSKKGGGNSRR